MPLVLGPGHITRTVADVNSRVRSICNDDNAQLWPDNSTGLLNAVRDAYNWLYGQIVRLQGQPEVISLTDLTYVPTVAGQEQDLGPQLPIDVYQPLHFYWRLGATEEYQEVGRRQRIPSRTQEVPSRVLEWEFRGNTIIVNSANVGGQFKLDYIPLLADLNQLTDPININNAIEAIAHYAAYELFRRRGQLQQAGAALGDDGTRNGVIPTGAKGFAAMLLDHLVLDEQSIPRRGGRFGDSGGIDTVSNRQFNG